MPTKYTERLKLPASPIEENVRFTTHNGLPIAVGYNGVVLTEKGPMVEFRQEQIIEQNVNVPPSMQWRRKHPEAYYAEFRSRDYCGVKVFEQRRDAGNFKAGMWYVSPFDLMSDKYPILIEKLNKKKNAYDN